jgi:DHA2 family methylenomycin A resistance protein-like MFS transporter
MTQTLTRPTTTTLDSTRVSDGQPAGQYTALAALCLGYFMVILDTTVANVALPDIQRQLSASFSSLQWVVDGYALVFASLLLTGGTIADRFGGRRTYIAGFTLFTAASALCGAAPTIWLLLLARAVQGIGAALLVPASLSLLRALFPGTAQRAKAIGIWVGTAGIAAGGGPVVGGFLVGWLGWRSAFVVNVPFGLLGLSLTLRYVHVALGQSRERLDLGGPLTSCLALGGFTVAIIEGGARGWLSPVALAGLAVGLAGFALLLAAERASAEPMLPRELVRLPGFGSGTAIGFLLNFGFYGQFFLFSIYLQQVRGLSPLETGIWLLPESGVVLFANLASGRLTARFGPRLPMMLGLTLASAGLLALIPATSTTSYLPLAGALFLVGLGMALGVPAVTASILELAPAHQSGISSAALNASRQMGGVVGVALLGALATGAFAPVPHLHRALLVAAAATVLGVVIASLSGRGKRFPSGVPTDS